MKTLKKIAFTLIGSFFGITLLTCGGNGGGGGRVSSTPPATATVVSGQVADAFIAGANVTAYEVNANGTLTPIGTPVMTGPTGSYSLNLGTYSGPVYLASQGGTYTDAATGKMIDLNNPPYSTMYPPFILSAIVPNASGNVTAQITPLTTIAAQVALGLAGQGTPVTTAATEENMLISNYFGLSNNNIINTTLLDLATAGCTTGTSPSADASLILAGISQLANYSGVSTPDLFQALLRDVTTDGKFDGMASGVTITVPLTSGSGSILLSTIEGNALRTGLLNAITTGFETSPFNNCNATLSQTVISALSNTSMSIFPSSAKAITAFSFTIPAATGTINETAKTIAVTVPYGTNVTALVATFAYTGAKVTVGSTVQISGTTPNDFTNPVSYVLTAADGSTSTYIVTVTVAMSSETVYELLPSSRYEQGCFAPCMCPIQIVGEIQGTFDLVPLTPSPLFTNYSVININWTVIDSNGKIVHGIQGNGSYEIGGEVALTQQMILNLSIDGGTLVTFDSGLVPENSQFPKISIKVANGTTCFKVLLDINAILKP